MFAGLGFVPCLVCGFTRKDKLPQTAIRALWAWVKYVATVLKCTTLWPPGTPILLAEDSAFSVEGCTPKILLEKVSVMQILIIKSSIALGGEAPPIFKEFHKIEISHEDTGTQRRPEAPRERQVSKCETGQRWRQHGLAVLAGCGGSWQLLKAVAVLTVSWRLGYTWLIQLS